MGLGLTISDLICQELGGSIDVDSVYGQGTTFKFKIYIERVEAIQI